MSKPIQILPDHVIQQIAAGEVVERPASIIKELLENSIDAGATAINIVIRQGGIDGIEISDNGHGIDKDQLPLALTAHATSKLTQENDLHHIQTRGFRGEALASIAAISHLQIHSKPHDQEHGFMIQSKGGELSEPQPSAVPNGTKINIAHLFYNTPARKKFLKSPNTEKNHIIAQIKKIALVEYGISFKIFLGDSGSTTKLLYHWSAKDTWLEKIEHIFPGDVKDKLLPVHTASDKHLSIQGYISNRNLSFSRSSEIYFYVNHRPVSDKTLQAALMEGYRTAMMEKRYPMAILKIDIDPQWVDVNIHPRKNEVRFSNPQQVFQNLAFAIKQSLSQQRPVEDAEPTASNYASGYSSSAVSNSTNPVERTSSFSSGASQIFSSPYTPSSSQTSFLQQVPLLSESEGAQYLPDDGANTEGYFSKLNFIGHIDHTYLLCSNGSTLIIIDQHAAHERVLFDQFKEQFTAESHVQKSQQLLSPITVNLSPEKTEVLKENLNTFIRLGFELEAFGPQSFVLRSTPAFLIKQDPKTYIENVCNDLLSQHQTTSGLEDIIDHICSSMACHSAVRAHDLLTPKEVDYLLQKMDHIDLASYCPHGRPTYLEYKVSDFEKLFKRV